MNDFEFPGTVRTDGAEKWFIFRSFHFSPYTFQRREVTDDKRKRKSEIKKP